MMNRFEEFRHILPPLILIASAGFVAIGTSSIDRDEMFPLRTTNTEAFIPEQIKIPGEGFNIRVPKK